MHEHRRLLVDCEEANGHTGLIVLGKVAYTVGIKQASEFLNFIHYRLREAPVDVLLPSGILRPQ